MLKKLTSLTRACALLCGFTWLASLIWFKEYAMRFQLAFILFSFANAGINLIIKEKEKSSDSSEE